MTPSKNLAEKLAILAAIGALTAVALSREIFHSPRVMIGAEEFFGGIVAICALRSLRAKILLALGFCTRLPDHCRSAYFTSAIRLSTIYWRMIDSWRVIFSKRGLVAKTVLFCVSAALLVTAVTPRLYRARTLLHFSRTIENGMERIVVTPIGDVTY